MLGSASNLVAWEVSRVAALAAFCVLALALLSGMAIRAGYLGALGHRKGILAGHQFLSWIWIPLLVVHAGALLLDPAAQIALVDLVIPFRVGYAANSALAIGLGTIGLLLTIVITLAAWLRGRLGPRLWIWIHRLSYPLFALFVLHSQLAGSDFANEAVSLAGWAVAGMLLAMSLMRLMAARVTAEARLGD